MGKFNFEDYRQPWETGPHWELKKEFMEEYSNMFSEDRLLCLAQAYSNIVLMHCSYPDPVMRQISHLSKPLQMRKRFQESNTREAEESQSQQQKSKRKNANENSEKPCKLIKFCAGKDDLTFSVPPNSTVLHENVMKQSSLSSSDCCISGTSCNILSVPPCLANDSDVIVKDQNQASNVKPDVLPSKNFENSEILNTLGLAFIQNFVQEIRKFQSKPLSAGESILSAAQKLKIFSQVDFKVDFISDSPHHSPQFCSELRVKGCVIASEQGSSKKKAKAKCAETALNILIKIASENRLEHNFKQVDSANVLSPRSDGQSTEVCMNSSISKCRLVENSSKESQNSGAVMNDMKILHTFSEILSSTEEFEEFVRIAKSLNFHNYITFNTSEIINPSKISEYVCQFLLKNILISTEKNVNIKTAKMLTVKSGFQKLKKLSHCEIVNGELKEIQNGKSEDTSNSASSSIIAVIPASSFILNQKMFDASMRDGFVLLDNLTLKSATQRNARAMLALAASFCHKHFEYKFEENDLSSPERRVSVTIGDQVVASGIASTRDQAKIIACDKALESLKKKYYTLKVKNEYNDGYIINRNQVFEGESFSSNALTKNNIGCRMLMNMGWAGGGLGTRGITEPVEAQGINSFGRGLGYSKEGCDLQKFKRKINSMLQDYSKTDTLSDLVFSKEFSKDERKEIHKIAQRYGLHTGSQGVNEERFLTVRHKYKVTQILSYLAKNGGSNSKFELVDATEKSFEFV